MAHRHGARVATIGTAGQPRAAGEGPVAAVVRRTVAELVRPDRDLVLAAERTAEAIDDPRTAARDLVALSRELPVLLAYLTEQCGGKQ